MSTDERVPFITRMLGRIRLSWVLVLIGLAWSARSVLDSFRLEGAVLGPVLVGVGLLWQVFSRREWKLFAVAFVLSIAYSVSAFTLIEFRADSASYFAYLRSLSFDGDLDFANDWEALGVPGAAKPGGRPRRNVFSVGPALLWSPFYAAAHVYVRWETWRGRELYEMSGHSLPYRRSTALGTVTVVVIGASLLCVAMIPLVGLDVALLSVLGSVLASPVLYYTFSVPAMSHGVSFGVAAALIWAWSRARTTPSLKTWFMLGGILGLLTLCRWQAAVYGLLVLPLAVEGLRRGSVRPQWLLAAAGAGALAFVPQVITWKLMFGRWLLVPQGRGFLDFSSANWSSTLFSANHGFFNWTPLMLLGFLGLVFGLGGFGGLAGHRKDRMLFGGALLVRPRYGSMGACRNMIGRRVTRSAQGATRWSCPSWPSGWGSRSKFPVAFSDARLFWLRRPSSFWQLSGIWDSSRTSERGSIERWRRSSISRAIRLAAFDGRRKTSSVSSPVNEAVRSRTTSSRRSISTPASTGAAGST